MKTQIRRSTHNQASVLVVGLVITAVLITTLLSYLVMVHRQNVSVARSQAWNASLALAEAGVEEALAKLNSTFRTNLLEGDGWSLNGNFYQPNSNRMLFGGYYAVEYTAAPPPIIYSTGYATIPSLEVTVRRAVEVKTTNTALFFVGIVAKSNITLNGGQMVSNSYNSGDPSHSNTNGQYDPNEPLSGGDVASAYGIVNGNRDIYGTLYLGPTATFAGAGQITGGIVNDFNMEFPNVSKPYNGGSALGGTTQIGTGKNRITYDNTMTAGYNYYVNGNYNGSIYIEGSNTVLYITGSANFQQLTLAPGASTSIYVGGANTSFGTVNNTGTARQLQYYGLPGNTSITMGGNDSFVGTIYAPNASVKLSGGGSNPADVQGAIIANHITSGGHFSIHFDESLKTNGPPGGYAAKSWKEIPP